MERQTVSREEYLRILNKKIRNHHGWQEIKEKAKIELEFKDITYGSPKFGGESKIALSSGHA